MTTAYTTLLGLALPVQGELTGTWGTTVNNSITQSLDDALAGTATASVTSGDWTLTDTGSGAPNQARCAILIATGTPGVSRNIIAPARSKGYFVVNQSDAAVVLKGASTTGVTIASGKTSIVAWNGSDFSAPGTGTVTSVSGTGTVSGLSLSGTVTSSGSLTLGGSITGFVPTGGALGTPSSGTLSSCTVDGTDAVGFRNIPVNSQSADYTAVLADSGKCIFHPSTDANARTFTIPANGSVAYPIGTAISFVNMTAQVVSIAITTDTMYLAGTGTTGTRSLAQYGTATALKLTSTTWIISGAGLT